MALIPCPECGRMISPNAVECPACGAPVKELLTCTTPVEPVEQSCPTNTILEQFSIKEEERLTQNIGDVPQDIFLQKKKKVLIWSLVAIIVVLLAVLTFLLLREDRDSLLKQPEKSTIDYNLNSSGNYVDDNIVNKDAIANNNIQNSETFPDNARIKKLLGDYSHAVVNNDFSALERLYAPSVERYHSAYGKSRDFVVKDHRNYDDFFKVYGKHSSLRWETFRTERINDGRVEAVIVEDYSLDRMDESKYSIFVLEKHFIINGDYQIVSVWDNQLSKKRKLD